MVTLTDLKEALALIGDFRAGGIAREALRKELLRLQGNIIISSNHSEKAYLVKAWSSDPTLETPEEVVEAFTQSVGTYFGRQAYRIDAIATHTREMYTSPVKPQTHAEWSLVLPTITATMGTSNFGVEGAHINNIPWIAYFRLHRDGNLYIHLGSPAGLQTEVITASLPPDYDSAYHNYGIRIYPNKAEFYIDRVLIATRYSPDFPLISDTSAWIMIGAGSGSTYIYGIRLLGGLDKHTEDYFIEEDGTIWNDVAITGGDQTDWVLCKSYRTPTLYFISDTAGNLTIQTQEPDGDGQTYDTVAIAMNTLEVYPIPASMRAVRISFNNAATVTAWWEFL